MGYLLMAVSVLTTLPKARACLARLTALLDTRPDVETGRFRRCGRARPSGGGV